MLPSLSSLAVWKTFKLTAFNSISAIKQSVWNYMADISSSLNELMSHSLMPFTPFPQNLTVCLLRDVAVISSVLFSNTIKWSIFLNISRGIVLRRVSKNHIYDRSAFVLLMAWCRQETNHYLKQCWQRLMMPYGITRPRWVIWRTCAIYFW